MSALDARYELRGPGGSRWISAIRFSTLSDTLEARELLTRIRIPLDQWNYTVYRKFDPPDSGDEGGVLIILVKNQKDILTNIQIVYAGETLLRDKNSETFLEGRALPLDRKDILHYGELWETYLAGLGKPGPLLRSRIINGIRAGILGLAD
jgi:CO/xanthine dehydrogenase FAD-binding subunit